MARMRTEGVHLGVCGDTSIRFRPTLTFEKKHLDIMLDKFNQTMERIK